MILRHEYWRTPIGYAKIPVWDHVIPEEFDGLGLA